MKNKKRRKQKLAAAFFVFHGAHLLSMILLYTCFLCLYIDISSKDTPYFVYILYTLHWCIVVLY